MTTSTPPSLGPQVLSCRPVLASLCPHLNPALLPAQLGLLSHLIPVQVPLARRGKDNLKVPAEVGPLRGARPREHAREGGQLLTPGVVCDSGQTDRRPTPARAGGLEEVEPPGRGGAAGSGARPPAPTPFGALVWAVTQKAPARSRAPGGGVRPGARRAAGQVGRVPKGRAGSWGCRRRRRAPGGRPAARGACLAERGAGAPGPPRDAAAAAAAASVGSTRARCGERSVSFGLFLCSAPPGFWAARGARRDVCAPRAAAPGAWEAGKGGCLLAYWGIFWMVSRGATGVPGRGVPGAAGRPRGAGEMVPGVAFLPSAGGLGLTAGAGERRCRRLGGVLGCPLELQS